MTTEITTQEDFVIEGFTKQEIPWVLKYLQSRFPHLRWPSYKYQPNLMAVIPRFDRVVSFCVRNYGTILKYSSALYWTEKPRVVYQWCDLRLPEFDIRKELTT